MIEHATVTDVDTCVTAPMSTMIAKGTNCSSKFNVAADGTRCGIRNLGGAGAARFLRIDTAAVPQATQAGGSARCGFFHLPKKLLNGKRHLPELILSTGYANLDLLPADFSYRNFDVHLAEQKKPTERLLKMSRSLRDVYAVLFLDCAPGISLLSENVLHAADAIIVPLLPTPLSVRMLVQLQDFVAAKGWADLRLLPFFSMVDRRKSLHHDIIAKTREQFPALLVTEVPYSSEIERMTLRRAPIPASAPRSAAAQVYSHLWAELTNALGLAGESSSAVPAEIGAAI